MNANKQKKAVKQGKSTAKQVKKGGMKVKTRIKAGATIHGHTGG
jgi:hypothetical protein